MVYTCSACKRSFTTRKGLNIHLASCKVIDNDVVCIDNRPAIQTGDFQHYSLAETGLIVELNELNIERENINPIQENGNITSGNEENEIITQTTGEGRSSEQAETIQGDTPDIDAIGEDCHICKIKVRQNAHALLCETCLKWHHQRCMKMSPIEYQHWKVN